MLGLSARELRGIDQELKEAVCNAIVNLTVARVSGSGADGEVLYGISPRRLIVSGQLLPRFDTAGADDETTDIRIAALGVDFQVGAAADGVAALTPSFCVYVRVLPTWEELTNENYGLDVDFKLLPAVEAAVDACMRRLKDERFAAEQVARPDWPTLNPTQRQRVRETRARIQSEVLIAAYAEQNIVLQRGDELAVANPAEGDDDADVADAGGLAAPAAPLQLGRLIQRGRSVPFASLQPARLPSKWRRIDLTLPTFTWQIGADSASLVAPLATYQQELQTAVVTQVTAWLRSPEGMREAWRDQPIQPADMETAAAWAAFRDRLAVIAVPEARLLPSVTGLSVQIDRVIDFADPSRAAVRVVLDNRTPELSRRDFLTRSETLFNAGFTLRLPGAAHQALRLDRVEPSYRFRHFLSYPAIGLNCGVNSTTEGNDVVLRTTWSPRFVQPRILAREIGIPVAFAALADEQLAIDGLMVLPREYTAWVAAEEARLRDAVRAGLSGEEADRESRRLADDLAAQRQEIAYIERGVRLLAESQNAFQQAARERDATRHAELTTRAAPYRAWLLTNRAFAQRGGAPGWRLFQLAFILAHVPTLASRMEAFRGYQDARLDEEAASLLYFPTGGGKSEAFYGALLFGMFLDRLRGKQRGVTALIRYPLRLLTLQQGQRLLKLIAHAEVLRRQENVGEWPFEIGFWVGGANTPNRYTAVPAAVPLASDADHGDDTRLEDNVPGRDGDAEHDARRYREFRAAYNKVPECPVCGAATGLRRFEAEGVTARRLGIRCFNGQCAWNRAHETPTPLPFLLTDDTIYQRAPAVVLGTVDKMAMLGQHTSTIRQLLGMFGLARGVGPTGHLDSPRIEGDIGATMVRNGYAHVFPAFRDGTRVFHDPFPSLIIQDEAHLLEESLGTFSGLFDSLFETSLRTIDRVAGQELDVARVWTGDGWAGPRMPKVIAATATISNPDRQLEVLYQRTPLRFPSSGSDLYRSFFAEPPAAPAGNAARRAMEAALPREEGPERTAPWMRLFTSLMTNDATHTVTAVAVLSAFHTIITSVWRGLLDPARRAGVVANLRAAQGDDVGAVWRQEAIDRVVADGRESEIMSLVDLHRIALAYVTNKKGGDQVMDALDAQVGQRHRLAHEPLKRFVSRLISGGVDMKEIQQVMEEAEADNPGRAYPPLTERIRSIIATSAISHGVDVDRFNSMFFAGLPSDIAEYIQASSRVGRTHVGFVILVPTPQSRRDRYVVETHDIFHRFLERMIAPPAVERWAENALRRVLASLVQTWAVLKETELFIGTPDAQKARAVSYEVATPIGVLARRDVPAFVDDLGGFALDAIGFRGRGDHEHGRPVYQELYRSLIEQEITRFAVSMRNLDTALRLYDYWADAGVFKPPMTSLRDVDEAGLIVAGAYDARARYGRHHVNLERLMHVMRAIRNQRGDVAETDADVVERRPA